ncbi:hypothetical protein Tco_0397174 [Tanacetum coccineum]
MMMRMPSRCEDDEKKYEYENAQDEDMKHRPDLNMMNRDTKPILKEGLCKDRSCIAPVPSNQEIKETHVTLTPVNPDAQQQNLFYIIWLRLNKLNPNQDTEPSFLHQLIVLTTLTPLFIQLQQPPILTSATTPSSSLQNLPDFALSSIPDIVDHYLENKMQEAIDVAIQLKYDRIREESHTENQQFLDSIDEGMKKVIKEQVKKEVSKITPKIEKLVNERISRCMMIKNPPLEQTEGPKEEGYKTHKQSASQSAPVEETMQSTDVFEAPAHQEFETRVHDEQPEEEVHPLPVWFQQPKRLPSPNHAWNKSVPADHESVQPWLRNLARRQDPRESFDELTDTTFDLSAFVMNRLNVTTLTPELLVGPTFELMKGTCKSLTELEYFCKEVYKATT